MKVKHILVFVVSLFLVACQATTPPTVTIIDYEKPITLQTDERIPSTLIAQAGITLNTNDHILLNGLPIVLDQPISNSPITLQIRRAVPITISSPQDEQTIQSSAFTIGEALQEANYRIRASDKVDPPLNSPVFNSPVSISLSRELTVSVDGKL